jgi:hypothetical protein
MKRVLWLSGLFIGAALLQAAPAWNGERSFKQPDGTTFKGKVRGDEYLHWIESDNGDIVIFNRKSRRYEKAEISTDSLIGSGSTYHRAKTAPAKSTGMTAETREALKSLWLKKKRDRMLVQEGIKSPGN